MKRRRVHFDVLWLRAIDDVIGRSTANRRKLDRVRAMECEHEAAADHVAKLTVGLAPVPGFAEELRKFPATGAGVLGDESADKLDVALGDHPPPVLQLHFFHGGEA